MKNANKKFTNTNIRVNCRFSFAQYVFEPRKSEDGGKPKYECSILVSKDDEQAIQLIESAVEAAKALYKEKYGAPKGRLKTWLHDGDEERPDDPNYANHIYFSAKGDRRPGVKMLEDGMLVDALDEEDFYSGCYGAADINFFPYKNDKSNASGIACGLNNVLKLEDGPKLSGSGMSANDAFADLA